MYEESKSSQVKSRIELFPPPTPASIVNRLRQIILFSRCQQNDALALGQHHDLIIFYHRFCVFQFNSVPSVQFSSNIKPSLSLEYVKHRLDLAAPHVILFVVAVVSLLLYSFLSLFSSRFAHKMLYMQS